MSFKKNIVPCIVYELLFWLTIPLSFLCLYIGLFNYPISSAFNHLYLLTWLFLSLLTIKLLLSSVVKSNHTTLFIVNLLNTSWLFITILYYSLVLIGLKSWGKVITTELIISYSHQASNFASFLGINLTLVGFFTALVYLALFFLCFKVTRKTQYKLNTLIYTSPLITTFLVALLCLSFSRVYLYTQSPKKYALKKEPVALTLSLGKPRGKQADSTQGLAKNNKLNKEEKVIGPAYIPNLHASKKNVILIVVDALTPKHMGIYGYTRKNTPFLSKLQEESESYIFHNTRASCSESACGLISLASSRYVHLIPETPFTLHQVLKKYGYKINMVMGGDHTNFYGLRSLYGKVDNYLDGSMISKEKYYINDDRFVIDKVKELKNWDKKPLMLQLHLMSSHQLGLRWPSSDQYQPSKKSLVRKNTPKAKRENINYYDNGVFQSDVVIQELITSLKNKGYLDDAIVVVTADHGESLGEHGKWSHGNSIHEEQLNIPLIFFNFGNHINITPSNNNAQVDIAPMILCALDMHVPKNWNGQACNIETKRNYTYFLNTPYSGLIDYSNNTHLWKYWKNTQTQEEYVFDLMHDPNESNNLALSTPPSLLNEWRKTLPTTELEF